MVQIPPMAMWRFASTGHGERYAVTSGMKMMPELYADSSHLILKVSSASQWNILYSLLYNIIQTLDQWNCLALYQ